MTFVHWSVNSLRDGQPFSSTCVDVEFKTIPVKESLIKAGVNVKVVLTLNLSAYFINHGLAVLCKFMGDFWTF